MENRWGGRRVVFSGWIKHQDDDLKVIKQTNFQQFNDPRHLLIDSNNRILIADTWNNQLVLLDQELKFRRILLNYNQNERKEHRKRAARKEEKERRLLPWRLNYNSDNKQLIVGMDHTNVVHIYHWNWDISFIHSLLHCISVRSSWIDWNIEFFTCG